MSLFLGIDISTQSCSGLVINVDTGAVVADSSINYGERLPQFNAPHGFIPCTEEPGKVHADPLMWVEALEIMFAELGTKCELSQIAAISGAGQQHASVYLNRHWFDVVENLSSSTSLSSQVSPCLARTSSPIWMDTSTSNECQEIADAVGGHDRVCAISGSTVIERFAGPQIRKFAKQCPEQYEQTERIHLASSFICSLLSGADAPVDTGDGAGMNLLNIKTSKWDESLLDATAPELRRRLPSVVGGGSLVKAVSNYFVKRFGFDPQTAVVVFTGDNPSSLIGMGASKPGKVVISLGTSDTIFAAMPAPVTDPDGFGHVFGNPAGGVMSLQCFVNGSLAREAVRDRCKMDWPAFTQAINQTRPGNEGNYMLPFFRPEISPRLNIDAPVLQGSKEFEEWKSASALARACVEGQFTNVKLRSHWMKIVPTTVYLTGGASANDAFAQIVADIFRARVERLAVVGSVALGAAMRAAHVVAGSSYAKLEQLFCQPLPGKAIVPLEENCSQYDTVATAVSRLIAAVRAMPDASENDAESIES